MVGSSERLAGHKRRRPGLQMEVVAKRRKAKKVKTEPEVLAKKVYHAKKALVRASQRWKSKNVASTKRRLKRAAAAHAALEEKQANGEEVPAKALANVRKKLTAATTDAVLMKELDLELLWDRWVVRVAGDVDVSGFVSEEHLKLCQEPVSEESDGGAAQRRKELLAKKVETAPSVQEQLRALKVELGRFKGIVKAALRAEEVEKSSAERSSRQEYSGDSSSDYSSDNSSDESSEGGGNSAAGRDNSSGGVVAEFSSEAVEEDSFESGEEIPAQGDDDGFVIGVPDFGEEFSSDGDEAIIPRDAAMDVVMDSSSAPASDSSDSSSSSSDSGSSGSGSGSSDDSSDDSSGGAPGRSAAPQSFEEGSGGSNGQGSAEEPSESSSLAECEGGFAIQVPFGIMPDEHEELAAIPRDEMVLAVMDSSSDSSDDRRGASSTDRGEQAKPDKKKAKAANEPKKETKEKKGGRGAAPGAPSSLFIGSLASGTAASATPEPKKDGEKKVKKKKNRKGQRARQQEWEAKYGKRAKHLQNVKKQAHASDHSTPAAEGLHPSWASRKAAAQKLSVGGFKGKKIVFGEAAGSAAPKAEEEKAKKGPKKQDFSKVHPSWASRQKKEKIGIGTAQGKRIKFDD